MSALRDFCVNVIPKLLNQNAPVSGGVPAPNWTTVHEVGKVVFGADAEATAPVVQRNVLSAAPAGLNSGPALGAAGIGEPTANIQAEIKKRLAALVGPYKEAVSRNGPAAAELQSLMAEVRQHVVQQDFEQAAKIFDELEPLVEQSRIQNLNGPTADGAGPALGASIAPSVRGAAMKVRGGGPATGLIEEKEEEEDKPSTGFPSRLPSDESKILGKLDPKLEEIYNRAFRSQLTLTRRREDLKDAKRKIPKEFILDIIEGKNHISTKPELAEKANNLRGMQVNMKTLNLLMNTVQQLMATFKEQQDATIAKIEAEELLKEADELRKQANELKEKRKLFNDLIEGALKLTSAALPQGEVLKLPERLEVLAEAFHTTNDLAEGFHKGIFANIQKLEQQADYKVDTARKKRLDALKREANGFEEARRKLAEVFTPAIQNMNEAMAVVQSARTHFEEEHDRNDTSGFKFAPIVKALQISSNIITKLVPEVRKATDECFGAMYHIKITVGGVPHSIWEDTWAWRREANHIGIWVQEQLEDLAELYDSIIKVIATSHDRPSGR